jgi:hypothetical protein
MTARGEIRPSWMRHGLRFVICGLLFALLETGCTRRDGNVSDRTPPPQDDSQGAPPASEPVDDPPDTTAVPSDELVVTETGIGPIRIGMTVEEGSAALGAELAPLGPVDPVCRHVKVAAWPEGTSMMVTEGTIARVDVNSPSIRTAAGARVGDTEERIRSLYPAGVEEKPHEYTDGNYLIVTPSPGGQIIFETDGTTVVRYRAGRLPEVGWVEGCS